MPKSEEELEQEIQASAKSTNRVTPGHLDEVIASEQFYVFPGTTVTVCALTLKNGFVVVGQSAAADPANFNEKIGQDVARDDARNKIWPLEGYLLRQQLFEKAQ